MRIVIEVSPLPIVPPTAALGVDAKRRERGGMAVRGSEPSHTHEQGLDVARAIAKSPLCFIYATLC